MPFFKSKRPYSNSVDLDPIGIANYKRRRLIEDFENLSLSEGQPTKNNSSGYDSLGAVTKIVPGKIKLSTAVKKKILHDSLFQGDRDDNEAVNNGKTVDEVIIRKIREWIREDSMQVIKWKDWRRTIYLQWLDWYQNSFQMIQNSLVYDIDGDYDIDNHQLQIYDDDNPLTNDFSQDMDVDMDA